MRAVRGGGGGGLGSSGAGQDGTRSPMLTLQMLPRDYKIYPSAWEEMQPYLDIFLRALACWSVILGLPRITNAPSRFHTKLQENLQRYYGLMLCDNINARLSSRQLSTSRHVSHTQHDHTRDTRTQYKSIHQHTKPRDQRPELDSSPLRIVASSSRR